MTYWKCVAVTYIAFLCLYPSLVSAYGKDPYKVLGVERGADDAAIKRAYKKLALKYHPDKNPKGQAKFIEIQHAYEILADADKKREYDLGGGSGGEYHHHQHQGSSRHHHHYHHYQQQQQYYYYQQQQQQQEQMYERALPSNTSFLTASNFRSLVMYGGRPWLVMVYTESSQACREFSVTWESLWKSLGGSQAGGGSRDGASVGLGRIHARFQRNLVQLIARSGGPFSTDVSENDLPLLIAVPNGCAETSCFVRYRGPLRLTALQDFVADRLLHLPRVPQLEPQTVAAFLRHASPYKVVVVAFGKGGGSGSLALRSLAAKQKDMLTVARAHVQEAGSASASAAAWQAALGLSSPPAAGHVVFLRGPGTVPHTVVVPGGKASELQQQMDEQGLLWQEIPPLRPTTGSSLGCLWGRAAATSGRSMIDACVLAVAPRGEPLEEARRRFALLGRYLAVPGAKRDPTTAAAATAYMEGKLRLVWLDASAQQPVCNWLMGLPDAMRPTNSAPPPGTNAAGRAAAAKQAMAAAAARSPELMRAVCGPAPLDVLGHARAAAAAVAGAAGLPGVAATLRPRRAAHVVVIRPSLDGSSWFRGRSSHLRQGRPVFLFGVNADFDLSSPDRGVDLELPKLASWINQMQSDPERHMHASEVFPPALRPDDEPGALEFVASRVYKGAAFVLRFVMNAGSTAGDGASQLSSELQLANLVVALAALVLVQMAFWRRPDGNTVRGHATERAQDARSRARAATATARAPRDAAASAPCRVQRQHRDSSDDNDSKEEKADGAAGSSRAGRSRDPVGVPLTRRATSPSWLSGRRGDAHGSESIESVDRAGEGNERVCVNERSSADGEPEEERQQRSSPRDAEERNTFDGGGTAESPEAVGVLDGDGPSRDTPSADSDSKPSEADTQTVDTLQQHCGTTGDKAGTVHAGAVGAGPAAEEPAGACPGRSGRTNSDPPAAPQDVASGGEMAAEEEGDGWTVVGSPQTVRSRHGS